MTFGRAIFVTYRPVTNFKPSGFLCRMESFPSRFFAHDYCDGDPAKAAAIKYLKKFSDSPQIGELEFIACITPGKKTTRRVQNTSLFVVVLPPWVALNELKGAAK